jgi:lipopolysaccharide export system protein LptA
MLAKKKASTVEFKGNVVVTRDDSIIHADSITMFFTKDTEKNANKKRKIIKIVAKGNVKYFSGTRKAYAGKAVYTFDNEILVLTENNPKVITDGNSITGKKITVFQKEDRITIEGGVNAVFIPDNKDKQKQE